MYSTDEETADSEIDELLFGHSEDSLSSILVDLIGRNLSNRSTQAYAMLVLAQLGEHRLKQIGHSPVFGVDVSCKLSDVIRERLWDQWRGGEILAYEKQSHQLTSVLEETKEVQELVLQHIVLQQMGIGDELDGQWIPIADSPFQSNPANRKVSPPGKWGS